MNLKHLHFYVDYRLLIILCGLLLFTFAARAQDVPVDTPPLVEPPATTDAENQLIEALVKMLGLNAPMSIAVTAVVAFLKAVIPGVPAARISIVVCIVGAILYYFARRAGLAIQLQSALDWLINLALPFLVMLFGGSTVHKASAAMNVPVLGYTRPDPAVPRG